MILIKILLPLIHQNQPLKEKFMIIEGLVILSPETVKELPRSSYNAYEWGRAVDKYTKYSPCTFYHHPDTDCTYVVYTIDGGLKMLGEVTYSSCLSNTGFIKVSITEIHDGLHILKTEKMQATKVGEQPSYGRADNSAGNRKIMRMMSMLDGTIFTNLF